MGSLFHRHLADLLVGGAYVILVLYIGQRGAKQRPDEENFFLAGRSLGKLYQFFLNFGQSTDAMGAVSTASIVYQEGASGTWLSLQTLFVNPYYWFMNLWFRRARLITVAELFEDRLSSRGLARFYAGFQIATAVVIVNGFSNLMAFKIVSSLVVHPERFWALQPAVFYTVYTLVLGIYIILGGMRATARNDALQGILILIFSMLLIPAGIHAIGGWHALATRIPAANFDLFGAAASQVSGATMIAILFVTVVAAPANINNMSVGGSARDEYAARFGAVSGTYAKRVMITLWAFTGLIAIALFHGPGALTDADQAWGAMSRQLLGPGFLGLMLTGILAGNMSTGAAHTMAISGLYVRNLYRPWRPQATTDQAVTAGRWAIAISLALGAASASVMTNAFSVVQLFLIMNVPFGAAILMMFLWRRLTAAAVWTAVILSALFSLIVPNVVAQFPAFASAPALTLTVAGPDGKPSPVYFETVSGGVGHGRFHVELYLLDRVGAKVAAWPASTRFAVRFLVSGLLPFAFLLAVSLCTRPPPCERVDQFFGKMKTPVGATPELEEAAMAETRRDPRRFDHTKLLPGTAWELTCWDRTDTIGFVICCGVSAAIALAFWAVLRLAAHPPV